LPPFFETGFTVPTRIRFGIGAFDHHLGALVPGARVLVLHGRSAQMLVERVRMLLADRALHFLQIPSGEPTTDSVDGILRHARAAAPDAVIGLGGGSAIDTAKATAALLCEAPGTSCVDFLEVDGTRHLSGKSVPMVAVPTLCGSGAEVTRNAVIFNPRTGAKRSLRHDALFPTVALVDPDLSATAPRTARLAAAVDAWCHLTETLCSTRATPFTLPLSAEGMRLLLPVLPELPDDQTTAAAAACASVLGGIALTNAGLTFGHGIGAVLGPATGISHGQACGLLLPEVLAWCLPHLPEDRRAVVRHLLGDEPAARVQALLEQTGFYRSIRARAPDDRTRDTVAAVSARAASTRATPGIPDESALRRILDAALARIPVDDQGGPPC
jgi:alcohol dehydrogenase class IV